MEPKLAVCGAAGRMGRRIIALCAEAGLKLVSAIEKQGHPDTGKDAGTLAGIAPLSVPVSPSCTTTPEVMIDFSSPQAAGQNVDFCVKNNVPLVLGTTGLAAAQVEAVKSAAKKIPIVYASNMSIGMNILFATVGKVASMLGPDYDIEIVEQHHRFKKDAPSGSALTLAENICRETGRDFPNCLVHGRSGKDALRQKDTIGMHAVRAGGITGIHSVIFSTLGETVTLNHTAHSRDTFALGALRAAKWLIGKKPALYSMADVLGLVEK